MSLVSRCFRRIKINLLRFYINYFCPNITIGENLNFRKGLNINCEKAACIKIGKRCFFNNYCSLNAHESIEIGNDCIFGEGVKIYDHNHKFDHCNMSIQSQGFSSKKVVIGENCWIGSNVVILPGTTIGSGTVIGAGCVIKGNIGEHLVVKNNNSKSIVVEPIQFKEN